jgi:hypothetical protein
VAQRIALQFDKFFDMERNGLSARAYMLRPSFIGRLGQGIRHGIDKLPGQQWFQPSSADMTTEFESL